MDIKLIYRMIPEVKLQTQMIIQRSSVLSQSLLITDGQNLSKGVISQSTPHPIIDAVFWTILNAIAVHENINQFKIIHNNKYVRCVKFQPSVVLKLYFIINFHIFITCGSISYNFCFVVVAAAAVTAVDMSGMYGLLPFCIVVFRFSFCFDCEVMVCTLIFHFAAPLHGAYMYIHAGRTINYSDYVKSARNARIMR